MEDIIKKAIEGGYERTDKNYFAPMGRFDCDAIVLDPLFWQALGKSCGWDRSDKGLCQITLKWEKLNPAFYADCLHHREATMSWYLAGKTFHETNLNSGWDSAVAYLTNLIKS